VCLYHVDGYSIYVMGSDIEKLEVKIKCDAFIVTREYSKLHGVSRWVYWLKRLGKEPFWAEDIKVILLEIYEDTNIWLTNEQREQLKQLRRFK
jgi:hypothetical protein